MKVWQKLGLIAAGLTVSAVAMADPVGTWRTIDDKTGQAKWWCAATKASAPWVVTKHGNVYVNCQYKVIQCGASRRCPPYFLTPRLILNGSSDGIEHQFNPMLVGCEGNTT